MHDYLATDGDSSVRSRGEESDSRRNLYSGDRDKNKVTEAALKIVYRD
jgi:Xaa-Pro aminopeptidase